MINKRKQPQSTGMAFSTTNTPINKKMHGEAFQDHKDTCPFYNTPGPTLEATHRRNPLYCVDEGFVSF